MECINALVCEHNFIFYDDVHGLLAQLAIGSVKPVLFTFEWLTIEGLERVGWGAGGDSGVAEQFDK